MPQPSSHLFISYASQDRAAAGALCAGLEARGLRCWMTPRDVGAGEDWGEAILRALVAARAAVVLLSRSADASPHVRNEVVAATAHRIPLVPVRLEPVEPSGALRLHLVGRHWLDAFPPPAGAHVEALAASVRLLLREDGPPPPAVPGPVAAGDRHEAMAPSPPSPPAATRRPPRRLALASVAALLLVLVPAGWLLSGRGPTPPHSDVPPPPPDLAAVQGGQDPAPVLPQPASASPPATPAPIAPGAAPAATPTPSPRHDLAVVNASQQDIDRLYLSPTSVTSWGQDLLGVLQLPAGSRVLLRASEAPGECWMDVRVVYHDNSYEERGGQNICALAELRFDGSTARRMQAREGGR